MGALIRHSFTYPGITDPNLITFFDREDREDLGRRAPLVGLFPLRLMRALRIRREKKPEAGSGAERRSH